MMDSVLGLGLLDLSRADLRLRPQDARVSEADIEHALERRALARAEGMVPLRADGWEKAAGGVTTVEELLRVTRDDTGV